MLIASRPAARFPGPSLYFHERAIERRRLHSSIETLLQDERFFEYVYAMLPAWGMHRMGKQAAKVGDFEDMVASFRAAAAPLNDLYDLSINQVSDEHASTRYPDLKQLFRWLP